MKENLKKPTKFLIFILIVILFVGIYHQTKYKISKITIESISINSDKFPNGLILNEEESKQFIKLFNKSSFQGRPDGEHGTPSHTVDVKFKSGKILNISYYECNCSNSEIRLYNSKNKQYDYYTVSAEELKNFVSEIIEKNN